MITAEALRAWQRKPPSDDWRTRYAAPFVPHYVVVPKPPARRPRGTRAERYRPQHWQDGREFRPGSQKAAIWARILDGASPGEIAREMGCTRRTVHRIKYLGTCPAARERDRNRARERWRERQKAAA